MCYNAPVPTTKNFGRSIATYNHDLLDDEYLTKLKFPSGSSTYDTMRRSDPQIKAVLQAVLLPILKTEYFVEPASDSPIDMEKAEFVEQNLFPSKHKIKSKKGKKINKSWNDTIGEIATFVPFGFSVLEKLWEVRDGKTYLKKLDLRPARTIKKFKFNDSDTELRYIEQQINCSTYQIPASKSVVFTFQQEGNNLAGIPLLRAMYKPWSIKQDLEKIQAMTFERFGMPTPVATTNYAKGTPQFTQLEEALESISINDSGYIVAPDGTVISTLNTGTGTAPDMLAAIKYYDQQISVTGLAQFLNFGTSASGNRSLGEEFIDFFTDFVDGINMYIVGKLNSEVVQELIDFNYPDTEFYPVIKAAVNEDLPLEQLKDLVDSGILTNEIELENKVRRILGVKEVDAKEPVVIPAKPTKEPAKIEASEHNHIDLADRKPTDFELMIDLAEIENNLDSELEATTSGMIDIRDKQAELIILAIIAGKKAQNITVPFKKDQVGDLIGVYDRQFKTGINQAKDEFKKQGQKDPSKLSADTRKNRRVIIEDDISVKVEGAGDKLKSLLLEESSSLQRQGIEKSDMSSALKVFYGTISIATWQNLSATPVNVGWGDGRAVFVEQRNELVDFEVYSAILDGRQCVNCDEADGDQQQAGENKFQTPNPLCLGGAKCRCVTITVYKEVL